MNKAELVKLIGKKAGMTQKAAESCLNAFVGAVHDSLKKKGGTIRISDLGTFLVSHRKARAGVNPRNKKKIHIPAANVPRFRAAKALRAAVKWAA